MWNQVGFDFWSHLTSLLTLGKLIPRLQFLPLQNENNKTYLIGLGQKWTEMVDGHRGSALPHHPGQPLMMVSVFLPAPTRGKSSWEEIDLENGPTVLKNIWAPGSSDLVS